jgi:uncharacterized OB-fold protein
VQSTDPLVLRQCDLQRGVQGLADDFNAAVRSNRAPIAQRCDDCGTAQFPPMLSCPVCRSQELSWVSCGNTGTVGTFVTVHTSEATPSMSIPRRLRALVPYTSVYVAPDAVPSVRVAALMIGPQQAQLRVGSAVAFDVTDDLGLLVNIVV